MNDENRLKHIKHHLIEMGISFRGWCQSAGVSHSVARDLVYGRLTGSKSEKSRYVKQLLMNQFGSDIFDD
jgi:hypothetical protein